jgi:hypothetical protein
MSGGKAQAGRGHVLQDLANRIQRDGVRSATLKFMTNDGEQEYHLELRTEEERDAALLALRKILGQVH